LIMITMPSAESKEIFPVGERHDFRLSVVKRPVKDIGTVIQRPDSPDLISDVEIQTGLIHPDDRGFFTELFRIGASPLTTDLPRCGTLQLSAALSYPGIIKALHYHFEQTDYWAPARGMLQAVLCDLREGSKTHGVVNTLYVGELRPWRLKILPGVGHRYKVIGDAPAVLAYLTDRFYNPRDEGRLEYDHPFLNYDWELQHK
jgi:dTDP-4-dehydrorhamnose 3,5-epimerase